MVLGGRLTTGLPAIIIVEGKATRVLTVRRGGGLAVAIPIGEFCAEVGGFWCGGQTFRNTLIGDGILVPVREPQAWWRCRLPHLFCLSILIDVNSSIGFENSSYI